MPRRIHLAGSSHPYQMLILAHLSFLATFSRARPRHGRQQLASLERQTISSTSLSCMAHWAGSNPLRFLQLFEIEDRSVHVGVQKDSSCLFHASSIPRGECERKRFHRLTSFTTVVQRSRVWIRSSLLVPPFDAITDFLRSWRKHSCNLSVRNTTHSFYPGSPVFRMLFFSVP